MQETPRLQIGILFTHNNLFKFSVDGTNHQNVIICLYELARKAGNFKVEVPQLIQIERQISENEEIPPEEEIPLEEEIRESVPEEQPAVVSEPPKKEPDPFLSLPMNKQHDLTVLKLVVYHL